MVIEITRRKLFVLLSILVVLIAVPLTVYLSQRQQETRSHAASDDSEVIVTFNNNGTLENITKGDVRSVAGEYADPATINNDTASLQAALSTLEERKILDLEAQKQGIDASADEVTQVENSQSLGSTDARYAVLKEKITLLDVHSVQAISVGFWSAPDGGPSSDANTPAQNTELQEGLAALPSIETGLKSGTDPVTLVSSILADSRYSALSSVLAVNSYIVSSSSDQTASMETPQIYEFGDAGLDAPAVTALFGLVNSGDTVTVTNTESNKGGFVFKLVQRGNPSGAATYADWLNQQESSLITSVHSL